MRDWSSILSPPWLPNPRAAEDTIESLQAAVPFPLSDEYKDLLRWANGGEGPLGEVYLSLWRVEDVARLNEGYLIRKYLPQLLMVGDASSHFYGFDYTHPNPGMVRISIGFVHPSGVEALEPGLEEILQQLATKQLY